MADVSVIIRSFNESAQLEEIFRRLKRQDYAGSIEYVVVDSGSTDETATIARQNGARVVHLNQADFTYPKALNVGIEIATAPIIICLVGHAYPVGTGWITAAIKPFDDLSVAGVYGPIIPRRNGTLIDWLLYGPGYLLTRVAGTKRIKSYQMGVFGATNLALRRSLWQEHHFDEAYGAGGEDGEWARWAWSKGFTIVRERGFLVRHCHYLRSWKAYRQQMALWRTLGKPRPFDRSELSFRDKKR